MKVRVIKEFGNYVPQVKKHWWSNWEYMAYDYIGDCADLQFGNLQTAIDYCQDYQNRNKPIVVWEGK